MLKNTAGRGSMSPTAHKKGQLGCTQKASEGLLLLGTVLQPESTLGFGVRGSGFRALTAGTIML